MRCLCAVAALIVVILLDACTKPFGFDVKIGEPKQWWTDGGTGPDNINREPIRR